jgi:hypothetical protein
MIEREAGQRKRILPSVYGKVLLDHSGNVAPHEGQDVNARDPPQGKLEAG